MSYYTYGEMPEELWPVRHNAPLSQLQQEYETRLFGDPQQLASGGLALAFGGAPMQSAPHPVGPVDGPGTGRSDEIEARLSPGEYVFDAETVALLGDGDSDAGARILDEMRENIRRHKGRALAKGEISPPAKSPLDYLVGED